MPKSAKRLFYRGFAEHDHIDVEDGSDQIGVTVAQAFESRACPNCNSAFSQYIHEYTNPTLQKEVATYVPVTHFFFCHVCGWWQVRQEGFNFPPGAARGDSPSSLSMYAYQYHSILENVDISSQDVVCADLRRHLLRHWDDRRLISAGKAEELVASLLKEHLGCDVYHSTSHVNTPDGGIDLFVCAENGRVKTAVQVKRRITPDVEPVEPIRSFVGALVIEGYDSGIYVTTAAEFSPGAKKVLTSRHIRNRRLKLELIDGQRLLELLRANTPPHEVQLPKIVRADREWVDSDGQRTSINDLLTRPFPE